MKKIKKFENEFTISEGCLNYIKKKVPCIDEEYLKKYQKELHEDCLDGNPDYKDTLTDHASWFFSRNNLLHFNHVENLLYPAEPAIKCIMEYYAKAINFEYMDRQ